MQRKILTGCPINSTGGTANCAAETDYSYDEPAYLTTPTPAVTTQHAAPPNSVRGNQTTVSRWLNTANGFISTHTNWYDTGEPFLQIDPLGHTTTFTYDPFYKGAYATQTCSPTTSPGSVTHCASGTYDFNTGVLTSLTNENAITQASGNTQGDSAHTSSFTYDFEFRITSAQAPPDPANSSLRAHTNFSFSSPGVLPITVQRTKSVTTALDDSGTNFFDGLARGFKGQHVLPNGTATVDTTFDPAGHPATVSNPYFSTGDPTYGITTSAYDGLDRVTQTTKQDGSISTVAYNVVAGIHDAVPGANFAGDCTDTIDEAGKQRRACSDALGRLTLVVEPNLTATTTTATGVITINGAEQTTSATAGRASVTISGEEQFNTIDPCQDGGGSCPHDVYDSGTVTITVNGHATSSGYFQGDTAISVAANLALAINQDSGAYVTASSSGAIVTLTARTAGAATNYPLLTNAATSDPSNFFMSLFSASPTSGALANGHDAGVGDSGTVTTAINGTNYQVTFGAGDTATSIASRLATALAGSTAVTASASGNQVNLTSKTAGSGENFPISIAYTWNSTLFNQPSFTTAASGLFGGYDAGSIDNNPYKTFYIYDVLSNLVCIEQHGSAATGTGCADPPGGDVTSPWRVRRFTHDSLGRLLTAKNPESGTISYLYDNDGELLSKTSPAANQTGAATQTVSYCYDELHRVIKRDYSAHTFSPPACPITAPVVSYTYDSGANAKGHLTQMTDQAGTASYSYDILGRLTTEIRSLTGANNTAISKTISYTYNLDGSVKTLTYPSQKVITYTPWNNGTAAVSTPQEAKDLGSNINYVTGATYGPDLALTGFVSGSGGAAAITNSFSYNRRLQPLAMSATFGSPAQTLFSISYDFHAGNGTPGSGTDNGNVWGITNNKDTTRSQAFTYDSLNRLSSAQNAGTNCTVNVLGGKKKFWGNSYSYDAWGNLLQKTVTKCSAENLSVTADAQNRIHGAAPDYTYDAAGNMLHEATSGLNYTWDQENRLTGAAGYTYTYDGDGNRVRKSNGNTATSGTLYWSMTPGVAETDLAGTLKSEYIFFDGERVARRDGPSGAGGVFYYFSDHLKTASVITDAAGVIKAESDYYPWGGELQFVNNDTNDYKFTGKKRDTETGLDYFGARYYANGLGRWVSADWSSTPVPVPYADFGDPQTLNLYGYVGGNPASKADPDGHCCTELIAALDAALAEGQSMILSARLNTVGLLATAAYKTGQIVDAGIQAARAEIDANRSYAAEVHAVAQLNKVNEAKAAAKQQQLGQARGAGEEQSQSDIARDRARTNGGIATEVHANDHSTEKLAQGYSLRDKDTGEVLKYGETTRGTARYTKEYLDKNNARMQFEAKGTKAQMHKWQHGKILQYKEQHDGARPPLNKNDY
jgi:RHS repeat-associated protein